MDCCTPRNETRRRDAVTAAGLTIGSALLIAAIMFLVEDPLGETIGLTMTPAMLVVGPMWLQLRRRSWRTKLLFVGGPLVVTFLIGLVAGWWVNS